MTDLEIACFFGVAESTFHLWKQRHFDFSGSIKSGKEKADSEVAESLYRAAVGGGVITETRVQLNAEGDVIGGTRETRQSPPSVSAMIFWLKNRQHDKWRDRFDHEEEINVNVVSGSELYRLYEDTMREARERQRAVLEERGLLTITE